MLICMAIAALFAVISLFVGIRIDPKTIGEWQVIQYWRIEWLLGAIVMLLFGVLLRKSTETRSSLGNTGQSFKVGSDPALITPS